MSWISRPTAASLSCNKDLLKQIRVHRGLTQAQLARHAGYTERLISKAESGQPISLDTIEILAQALSTPESVVYPDDLISDPLALSIHFLVTLYEHQEDSFRHLKPILSESIEIKIAGDPKDIPFAGMFYGHQGASDLVDGFFSVLECPAGSDVRKDFRFIARGLEVAAFGGSWWHPKGGPPLDRPMLVSHLFRYQGGKLVWFEDIFDTQRGAELLAEFKKHEASSLAS